MGDDRAQKKKPGVFSLQAPKPEIPDLDTAEPGLVQSPAKILRERAHLSHRSLDYHKDRAGRKRASGVT